MQACRGCLSVIGAKACAGAPVALWEEHGRVNQRWSLNEDGSICSHLNRSLALDLRGTRTLSVHQCPAVSPEPGHAGLKGDIS